MPARLFRLGRWCAGRPKTVIATWVVLVIALAAVAHAAGSRTSDVAQLSGTDSAAAQALMDRALPAQAGPSSPVVLTAASGRLDDADHRAAVTAVVSALDHAPHVTSAADPLQTPGALSADGRTAIVPVAIDLPAAELDEAAARAIVDPARAAGGDAVQVAAGGDVGQRLSRQRPRASEIVGIVAAVIVLTLVLGTLVAMVLPLASAILALAGGLAAITLFSHVANVPAVAPTLGTMIGLGVGIDYALFLISRYREARAEGMDPPQAAGTAQATAGTAIVFAGATVVVALAALAVAGIPPVTGLGLSAAAVVVVAVVAACTLMPALVGLAGRRIDAFAVHRDRAERQTRSERRWAGWARGVVRHRIAATVVALVVLAALAIPMLSLQLGQTDPGSQSPATTARQAYDRTAAAFGAGANGPLLVTAQVPAGDPALTSGSDPRLTALAADLAGTPGVASVAPARVSEDRRVAALAVTPTTGPADPDTAALVRHLRDGVLPGQELATHVGGSTATQVDLADRIAEKLPLIIAVVVAISSLLLLIAFRSVALPLKAAVANLLSVAAAYGVLVAVFQWGWGAQLIGLDGPVAIVSYVPMLMFAILFGLSMDYEVFLLSRVQERHRAGATDEDAIVGGLSVTGRIITAAALIMVSVFASFLLTPDPLVKMFGVGLAAAIAIDATIVRCLLVPAAMALLGRAAWWCPGWLARRLPRLDL